MKKRSGKGRKNEIDPENFSIEKINKKAIDGASDDEKFDNAVVDNTDANKSLEIPEW